MQRTGKMKCLFAFDVVYDVIIAHKRGQNEEFNCMA